MLCLKTAIESALASFHFMNACRTERNEMMALLLNLRANLDVNSYVRILPPPNISALGSKAHQKPCC